MTELVDVLVLETNGVSPCGFDSRYSHQFNKKWRIDTMSIDKTKLLELYPEFDTVGDPTINKDGRSRIMLRRHPRENEPGKNKLMSYPRALMEVEYRKFKRAQ